MYLKVLSVADGTAVYQLLQKIGSNENGFHNDVYGMTEEEYHRWLTQQVQLEQGIGTPDWMVQQTTFWLYDGETPVACGRIRHELNDSLREHGGHIGYVVCSDYRGQGFGTEFLRLLLVECRKLGINPVQLSINQDNLPSNRLIRKFNGVLFRQEYGQNFYQIQFK